MSSKGNPVVHCRLSAGAHQELLEQIAMTNETRFDAPLTVSAFVELAVLEKLAKMRRSRGERGARLPCREEIE